MYSEAIDSLARLGPPQLRDNTMARFGAGQPYLDRPMYARPRRTYRERVNPKFIYKIDRGVEPRSFCLTFILSRRVDLYTNRYCTNNLEESTIKYPLVWGTFFEKQKESS